jgi:hypothetical protein
MACGMLRAEGDPNGLNAPKMLSIGLHCRIAEVAGVRPIHSPIAISVR